MTTRSRFARGRRWTGLTPELIELKRGAFSIGVISDTHGQLHPGALARLCKTDYALVLHAGDIGKTECLRPLDGYPAPVRVVRGNIDPAHSDYPEVQLLDLAQAGQVVFRLLLLHIALAGPRLLPDVAELALAQQCDLVVCGHSHMPWWGLSQSNHARPLPVFNPGSVGPRRFGLPIAMGELHIDNERRLQALHLDCETGQPWLPKPRSL